MKGSRQSPTSLRIFLAAARHLNFSRAAEQLSLTQSAVSKHIQALELRYVPLMPNSDHANVARHGIPAMRLPADFEQPDSRVNNILSPGDVPSVVDEAELRDAVRITCALAWRGLTMTQSELDALAGR